MKGEKTPSFTEGRAPGIQKPTVKPEAKPKTQQIEPQMTELTPDIAPTVDKEVCVFPEAHRVEERITKMGRSPLAKYIVMGEVLGTPKCRRKW